MDEEVNAYVADIDRVSISEVVNVLPKIEIYNSDIIMSQICDCLARNINIMRQLNDEAGNHALDGEIVISLKKYYICVNAFNHVNAKKNKKNEVAHQIVFAKTANGKPYFIQDLDKVPKELYGDVAKALNLIINGVNMSNISKVRFYNNSLSQKVLEFKGFQARIFTTKLKGNILCILGLVIKKATDYKKIQDNLKYRLIQANSQIEGLRQMMNDPEATKKLLSESKEILDEVMKKIGVIEDSDDVELLFPDDEQLNEMVPYSQDENLNNDVHNVVRVK